MKTKPLIIKVFVAAFLLGMIAQFSFAFVTPSYVSAAAVDDTCNGVKADWKDECTTSFNNAVTKAKAGNTTVDKVCGDKPAISRVATVENAKYTGCTGGFTEGEKQAGITATTETGKSAQSACNALNYENTVLDACVAGYTGGAGDKNQADSCKDLPNPSQRLSACQKGYQLGKNDQTGAKSQVDCDASGAILSWIICPVVDMGAGLTDYVFNNLVQPLLENVPVSSDPTSHVYQVWSTFRILANVLLVGTLLAIVYSQARGPK